MIVEREIDGVLYKAEFKGMAFAFSLDDLLKTKRAERRLTEILFSEILISPKVQIGDFKTLNALDKVRSFLLDVALGAGEKPKSESRQKQIVDERWYCYRLVVNEVCPLDYDLVFNKLPPQEIQRLNISLDKVYERINKSLSGKK